MPIPKAVYNNFVVSIDQCAFRLSIEIVHSQAMILYVITMLVKSLANAVRITPAE